jgi:hypothetical protein
MARLIYSILGHLSLKRPPDIGRHTDPIAGMRRINSIKATPHSEITSTAQASKPNPQAVHFDVTLSQAELTVSPFAFSEKVLIGGSSRC